MSFNSPEMSFIKLEMLLYKSNTLFNKCKTNIYKIEMVINNTKALFTK
jgi:hypothetical protein